MPIFTDKTLLTLDNKDELDLATIQIFGYFDKSQLVKFLD